MSRPKTRRHHAARTPATWPGRCSRPYPSTAHLPPRVAQQPAVIPSRERLAAPPPRPRAPQPTGCTRACGRCTHPVLATGALGSQVEAAERHATAAVADALCLHSLSGGAAPPQADRAPHGALEVEPACRGRQCGREPAVERVAHAQPPAIGQRGKAGCSAPPRPYGPAHGGKTYPLARCALRDREPCGEPRDQPPPLQARAASRGRASLHGITKRETEAGRGFPPMQQTGGGPPSRAVGREPRHRLQHTRRRGCGRDRAQGAREEEARAVRQD
mmetsp:Transcript_4069/g.12562  ORF Transcript_4069/g.12562 Transcript_4069/m.12562 type:complete len:274 (-) Transcript_4069:723-1544(-)